jgi:hypothetical protein
MFFLELQHFLIQNEQKIFSFLGVIVAQYPQSCDYSSFRHGAG